MKTEYEQWRKSHQPFHWFAEFYGIMRRGGFDVIIGNPLKNRNWAYRRSGLFGREDNQEGGVPVALTLQQLDTVFSSRKMLYTTAMEIDSVCAAIRKCETDFVVLVPKPIDHRVQIAIGECKTRQEITEGDVANLKLVADAFPRNRFEVFVIFSKLANFSPEEIKRCSTLNDKYHQRVILLTPKELEPYRMYEITAKEHDIDKYAASLEDMANITYRIYFEPKASAAEEEQVQ